MQPNIEQEVKAVCDQEFIQLIARRAVSAMAELNDNK